MTSLYVDRRGITLKADGEALVFYENGERVGTVPLAPLSRVFMRGDVTLSSALLGKLGERGIGVVVLSGRKAVPTMLLGRPHNDAARRVAQYRQSLDTDFCLRFSRAIVEAKLRAQAAFLDERRESELRSRYLLTLSLRRVNGSIAAIDAQTRIASLRGLEGAAAAAYFEGFGDLLPNRLNFSGRNRRPPRDPVNAVLSLGYTLLHAEAVLALYGAGLDPFVGFYHTLDFARESLACDLVEPLRVEIDKHVLMLFRSEKLRPEDFSHSELGCLLGKAGRARFYAEWEQLAARLRKLLAENVADVANAIGLAAAPVSNSADGGSDGTEVAGNEFDAGDNGDEF
ncbi:MAG TPA: CRISPR-associated endonuclease Cas1 [Candidatus Accumulibacter phosphatis]|nr:MAG: CRISPR-associated protein Cas4/endonuclease Cas1 fusion [Candidatus Accumulibacter sp. SK-11]HAY27445.1 CRISPR-associated endonuclease Cas1 [Accumulibacter sp.]HCV13045.1 CRISPR-associated endonuclease Cas1 [Accumulibacter sp.]HRL78567.1 CRISPR-associated endonuclease Cas1 [Candidatus Accumulibacter phosphatis]HRQ97508.1 CRISPR-associated endonuclease Cas1 [Candidatus Accumulibacter phosphatis]